MLSVFFSYSHRDEELRNELEINLSALKRQGIISTWHDRRIDAGSHIDSEIEENLENSQIILLLVSPYFIHSDYCYDKEMTRALEKHADNSSVVIPIILHPCDWHGCPFGQLMATPTDGKPISTFGNMHEAFVDVTKAIRRVADKFSTAKNPVVKQQVPTGSGAAPSAETLPRSSNLRIKKTFSDHEKDEFLEASFNYISRFFAGSLQELSERNDGIEAKHKKLSETKFSSAIYSSGKKVASCSIWYGDRNFGSSDGICFSHGDSSSSNSFNESMSIENDGYTLQLKPLGMAHMGRTEELLTQQGAAEYFWSMLVDGLQ